MIVTWLLIVLRFIGRLIIPPPKPRKRPSIDPETLTCAACGTVGLQLKYVIVSTKPEKDAAFRRGLLRVTCPKCGAFYHIEPLYKKSPPPGQKPIGADEVGGQEVRGLTT